MLPATLLAATAIYLLLQLNNSTPTNAGPIATPTPISTPPGGPHPLVIDTDMAMDDWLAILYLLQRKDYDVVAITVVGTGEAHCEPGVRNARGLLALAGYNQIPVACGRDTPFEGGHSFPNEWRTSADNMLGLTLPAPLGPVTDPGLDAPRLLASIAGAHAGRLSLVSLGPLTNIADALRNDPSLAANLAGFYVMGSAVGVPGNVQLPDGSMSAAEWNFYADPHAAAIVFQSGAPITLVPLDATNTIPLTRSYLKLLEANHQTPAADFVYRLLKGNQFLFEPGAYYLWDTLAAVLFTDHTLSTFREERLQIIEDGLESGRTAIAPTGPTIHIPASVDAARFQQLFFDVLNTRH
ncbi:MAG: nucleoside hydrolase [Chloroflexota bacterium]